MLIAVNFSFIVLMSESSPQGLFDIFEYNLSNRQVWLSALIFSMVLVSIGIYATTQYKDAPKKMAWIVSMFNSGFMTLIGMFYMYHSMPSDVNVLIMGSHGRGYFHGIDNVSFLVCLWFAMANAFDLALGFAYYRKYLDPLTAYVHHPVFIWIMSMAATGNGWFFTTEQFGPGFALMLIEELPTFLLALGYVFSQFRTDIGFGVTFFSLRIVYHIYMFLFAIWSGASATVLFLYSLTTTLHVYWFSSWFRKYGSKAFSSRHKQL